MQFLLLQHCSLISPRLPASLAHPSPRPRPRHQLKPFLKGTQALAPPPPPPCLFLDHAPKPPPARPPGVTSQINQLSGGTGVPSLLRFLHCSLVPPPSGPRPVTSQIKPLQGFMGRFLVPLPARLLDHAQASPCPPPDHQPNHTSC